MSENNSAARKLTSGLVVVIVLLVTFAITSFALVFATVRVDENTFQTGVVKINLNDGKPVIHEDEFLFEPGMTVVKDFFIQNESTWSVYYRIYFGNVSGGLADVLEITIHDGPEVLYRGTARDLTRLRVSAANDVLEVGERRDLTVTFHYPRSAGNDTQDQTMQFNICADAVQTKNNPHKLFD